MQGIFINGMRPKSKKQVKEAVAADPASVAVEATSMFGNEYGGPAMEMPFGGRIHFVGPDPAESRKFYGTLERTANGLKVT